jgi:hypothetical protein
VTVKIIARVLLTLGFLAASIAYSSWTVQRTILDPSATRIAAQSLLDTPAVKAMLAKEIRTSLLPALGPKTDPKKLSAAIDAAVVDPTFVGAYQDAIVSIQKSVFSEGNSRVTLDSRAVTRAITKALTQIDPSVARRMKNVHAINVPVGSTSLPHVRGAESKVALTGRIALALACLMVGGALLLVHDRKMLRRASRRLAFLAIGPTLAFAVLPRLLDSLHNPSLEVGAAMLEAFGHRVLVSAAILAVAGISGWLMTFVIPERGMLGDDEDGDRRPSGRMPAPDVRVPSRRPVPPVALRPVREGLYL